MSWKLAEWQWRQDVGLRERPSGKSFRDEDIARMNHIGEEYGGRAEAKNGVDDRAIETQRHQINNFASSRLGSIQFRINPHPASQTRLLDLSPTYFNSYHLSCTSSTPLLVTSGSSSHWRERPDVPSLGPSAFFSPRIRSSPSEASARQIPQESVDFLDNRAWPQLYWEQRPALRLPACHFGPNCKPCSGLSPSYRRLAAEDRPQDPLKLERVSGSLHQKFTNLRSTGRNLAFRRTTSACTRSTSDLTGPVIPWSNLDHESNNAHFFIKYFFKHEGAVFEIINPHELSFGAQLAISPEYFLETSFESSTSYNNSSTFLPPKADMAPLFKPRKSNEKSEERGKRKGTPPAKVFEDLPSAHYGILGQFDETTKFSTQSREMKNMAGPHNKLPPLIELPAGRLRPGPISPAVQRALFDARNQIKLGEGKWNEDKPKTISSVAQMSTAATQMAHQAFDEEELDHDYIPAREFGSGDIAMDNLRHIASHDSGLNRKILIRNSFSMFNLAEDPKDDLECQATGLPRLIRNKKAVVQPSSTVGSVVNMYSDQSVPGRDRANSFGESQRGPQITRGSREIIGMAISNEDDYIQHLQRFSPIPTVPARSIRRTKAVGQAPKEPLPVPPAYLKPMRYEFDKHTDSESTKYDNTQSLLGAGIPHSGRATYNIGQPCSMPATVHTGSPVGRDQDPANESALLGFCDRSEKELRQRRPDTSTAAGESSEEDISPGIEYRRALKGLEQAVHYYRDKSYTDSGIGKASVASEYSSRGKQRLSRSTRPDFSIPDNVSDDGSLANFALKIAAADPDLDHAGGEILRHNKCDNTDAEADSGDVEWEETGGEVGEESEDDGDWETMHGSVIQNDLSSLQLKMPAEFMVNTTNPSLANMSTCGTISSGQGPVTPWDPLSRGVKAHPARSGTPHQYRLRKDQETGEEFWIPEYSKFTIEQQNNPHLNESLGGTSLDLTEYANLGADSLTKPPFRKTSSLLMRHNQPASSLPVILQRRGQSMASPHDSSMPQGGMNYEVECDEPTAHGKTVRLEKDEGNGKSNEASDTGLKEGNNTLGKLFSIDTKTQTLSETFKANNFKQSIDGVDAEHSGLNQDLETSCGLETSSMIYQPSFLSQDSRPSTNEEFAKRMSMMEHDGSYCPDDEAMDSSSVTEFMIATKDKEPWKIGTYSKTAQLGARDNLTGSSRNSQMRVTGSASAYVSPDIYNPATARGHDYDRLSSEATDISKEIKETKPEEIKKKFVARKDMEKWFKKQGIDPKKHDWGSVSRDITGITTSNGCAIGPPTKFIPPRSLAPANMLTLNRNAPLVENISTQNEIKARMLMAQHDWKQLCSECPIHPLRDDQFLERFKRDDPRRTGELIYERSSDGNDSAYCFYHQRREWKDPPTLKRKGPTAEEELYAGTRGVMEKVALGLGVLILLLVGIILAVEYA